MFPDVQSQEWPQMRAEEPALPVHDAKLRSIDDQPRPSGAECSTAALANSFEGGYVSK